MKKLLSEKLQKFLTGNLKLLSAMLGILCFVILPGLIILAALNSITAQQEHEQATTSREQLEKKLDDLEYFSRNERFAHFLLYPFCHKKNGEKESVANLPQRIRLLKKRFPGVFTIVVSDLNGKLIDKLSDESGFSYLFRQAFILISELEKCLQHNISTESLENLDVRLSRLKTLLGNIINPKDMLLPLRPIEGGRSILAAGDQQKFHIWYGSGKDFRMLVYISRSFIRSNSGLEWATRTINRISPDLTVGYSSFPPDENSISPKLPDHVDAEVIKLIATHENGRDSLENSTSEISACRFFDHQTAGFSIFNNSSKISARQARIFYITGFIKIMLVLIFIFTVFHKKHPLTLTVKLKITAFFSYVILLPVLTITSLTSIYIAQEEMRLKTELQNKAHMILEKIDSGYDNFSTDLAINTHEAFSRVVENNESFIPDQTNLQKLFDAASTIVTPGDAFFINLDGKDLMQKAKKPRFYNSSLLRRICTDALQGTAKNNFSQLGQAPNNVSRNFIASMRQNNRIMRYLGISDLELAACFKIGSPRKSLKASGKMFFMATFWRLQELYNIYVERYYKKYLSEHDSLKFAAFCNYRKRLTVAAGKNNHGLLRFMQLAGNRYSLVINDLRISGKKHTGIALAGRKLKTMTLACLFPYEIVADKITVIRMKSRALTVFLIALGIATMVLLRNWIFRPLEELRRGLSAIASRNFSFRLEKVCNNELGKLMDAFNHSLDTLQELEVARIVQESILSQNHMQHLNVQIIAKSLSMTNLGGDYFDMAKIDNEKVLAFVGDATGHGVPAALSMAMAKAIISHESSLGLSCKNVISQLNRLFRTLRKQGTKDFMTAICLEINCENGNITAINAGQCFPLLLKKDCECAEILSQIRGMPPGFSDNYIPEEHIIKMQKDDSLFIFSDGLVECCNKAGSPLGFNGLAELVGQSWNSDPQIHLENILEAMRAFSGKQQDDCTIMLLRFS